MKSILFIFLSGLIAFGTTSKVQWLEGKEHDFGDILRHQPVEYHFQFTNVSEGPLIIDNVRTSCGCTAPDWTEAPIAVADTSSIRITYNAKKKGYFRKKIKVYFDGQRKAEVLYVEGYVYEEDEE